MSITPDPTEPPVSRPDPAVRTIWGSWPGARILGLCTLLVVGNFLIQVVVFLTAGGLFLPVLLGALCGVILPVIILARQGVLNPGPDLGWDRPHPAVLVVSVLMAVAALPPTSWLAEISLRLHPADPAWAAELMKHMPTTTGQVLVAVAAVVIAAPLAEELMFRSLLNRLAVRTWGILPGILISSLVFGIVHGEPWYLFGLVGVGLVLGFIFSATRSVSACWLAHAVHNGVSLWMMLRTDASLTEPSSPTATDAVIAVVSLAGLILMGRLLWKWRAMGLRK